MTCADGNCRAGPPRPAARAAEMFALARMIREQATGQPGEAVRPEIVARIAVTVGALAEAIARADAAYAEGLRQRAEAAERAADAADAPDFLQPQEPPPSEPDAPCCASCRHFRPLAPDAGRIPGTAAPEGVCGLRDPSRREGMTRYCRARDWCDRHEPINVTKGPGA